MKRVLLAIFAIGLLYASPVEAQVSNAASCGSANGSFSSFPPGANLCAAGTPSPVAGAGPWTWTCTSTDGTATAGCSAQIQGANGVCGPANGGTFDTTPSGGLCNAGTPTNVAGAGPWTWTCLGSNGGQDTGCSAQQTTTNGACGSANGSVFTSVPGVNLCNSGTPSPVRGAGPWSWTCDSQNGGVSASCSAQVQGSNGTCGSANGSTFSSRPSTGLCSSGTPSSVAGAGPWSWTCSGENGGSTASCTAEGDSTNSGINPANAVCGSANNSNRISAPTAGLCGSGTPSSVSGNGPWSWTCSEGPVTVSCSAQTQARNGTCGSANGSSRTAPPTGGLCGSGTPSAISGTGPWTWTCLGSGGGGSATCSAELRGVTGPSNRTATCGSANNSNRISAPTAGLCGSGTASAVSGNGPWTWTCNTPGGEFVSCSAELRAKNATCGPADGTFAARPPSSGLCGSGTPSVISGTGPWMWTCSGSNGGTNVNCMAQVRNVDNGTDIENARCGSASNVPASSSPTSELCARGTPSSLSGNGPWSWTCSGNGAIANCAAPVAQTNAQCGSASGTTVTSAPNANLCMIGTPSPVSGSGPWNWTCLGVNGGASVGCSADIQGGNPNTSTGPNGARCGSASGVSAASAPTSELCATGMASAINGTGPWNWICTGTHGALANCSAPVRRTNAACGSASGSTFSTPPSTGLCNVGMPSTVSANGNQPWAWTCMGLNGGASVGCMAQRGDTGNGNTNGDAVNAGSAGTDTEEPGSATSNNNTTAINGACGAANGTSATYAPATGLCVAGTASGITGSGPYAWTCSGTNGGTTANCSTVSSAREFLLPAGILSTSGSQIVDSSGASVRMACVGWDGVNGQGGSPAGLDLSGYKQNLDSIAAAGFNCVRMSWSTNALSEMTMPNDINYSLNPELTGLTQLQVQDAIINYAGQIGLKVVLDHWHDTTSTGAVAVQSYRNDWTKIAQRYAGNRAIAGYSLNRSPMASLGASSWADGNITDLHAMYHYVGNAIQAVDSAPLIILEGPMNYMGNFAGTGVAPEGDLSKVATHPIVLNIPNKVVYRVHEFPDEISGINSVSSDNGPAAIQRMNAAWGYLVTENIAPVWVEMGSSMISGESVAWAATMVSYLNGQAMNGLTIPSSGQGVSTDWWAWGNFQGFEPQGLLDSNGAIRQQQKAVTNGLRFRH